MSSWPHERAALVGTIDPQTVANAEKLTDEIDMSKFHEVLFIFLLGDMAAETIDCQVHEAATSGGSYQALKSATQLSAHASNNDNKQVIISVKSEELSAGYRYLKGRMITGNSTGGPAACVALGFSPRFGPGTDDDLTSIAEIKT